MAQRLTVESNPRRQGSFKNKARGIQQDENYYLTEETIDEKGARGQNQLAAYNDLIHPRHGEFFHN